MSDCLFSVSPVNYPDPDPDTYRKHFSDIGFTASQIHLKIGRFFFGSVYMYPHFPKSHFELKQFEKQR